MKHAVLIFIFMSVVGIQSAWGQVSTEIQDESGESIPYLILKEKYGDRYIASDSRGVVNVSATIFPDTTTLTAVSDFYGPLEIAFGALKELRTLRVKNKVTDIESVSVYPQDYIEDLVEKMADFFADNYARDYIATASIYRTIKSADLYRQLYCVYGLWGSFNFTTRPPRWYFDSKNPMGCFIPLDSYVSYNYLPNENRVNTLSHVTESGVTGIEQFYVNFVNNLTLYPLLRKQALEYYSPLNPRQKKNFNYWIERVYNDQGEKVFVLCFQTKADAFPKRTKIYGSGRIFVRENGFPFKVEIQNAEERYSYFIRRPGAAAVLVSPYTYSVEYAMSDNHIYARSVTQSVRWELPANVEGNDFYYVEWNTYRQPFKNKLSTMTSIQFEDPLFLSGQESERLRRYFSEDSGSGEVVYYVDPINRSFWEKRLQGIDGFDKIERDLTATGVPLYEQACESCNLQIEGGFQRYKDYYVIGRELYKQLYDRAYYE